MEKYGRVKQATDNNLIRRLRFTYWITEATDTHSEYVILVALPRQQWLREYASMLRQYIQGDQKVSVHLTITVYHQVHRDFLITLYIFPLFFTLLFFEGLLPWSTLES